MSSALTEEEQLSQLKSVTKKYGSSVVTGVLIAVIAFLGWNYWQKKDNVTLQNETARVQQIMDQAPSAVTDKTAFANVATLADTVVKKDTNSAQAIQAQLVMAKIDFDKADYAAAERELLKVQGSTVKDEGLKSLVNLHLAYAQTAQKKYADALKTLDLIKVPSFAATVNEARGDIFVDQNDKEKARQAYQDAWKLAVERKQERQILQIKLESVGILVDDPEIDNPILDKQEDAS